MREAEVGTTIAISTRIATAHLCIRLAPSPSMPQADAQLRVLVVDDNEDAAVALSALLTLMGCATALAFGGAQALVTAARFNPQLALIDLEMPGMNGCEVARRLRAGRAPTSATLICLTGRGQPEDRRLCIDAGFDDFFAKPMQPESLTDVVAAANAGRLR